MKKLSIILAVAVLVFCQTSFGLGLQNGTFDTDLSGWATEPATPVGNNAVVWYDGTAVLLNPDDFPLDPSWPFQDSFTFTSSYPEPAGGDIEQSTLSQTFLLPDNAVKLSFDVTVEVYSRLGSFETDILTVKLEGQEIFGIECTDVLIYSVPGEWLVEDYDYDEDMEISTYHKIYYKTVEWDVSSLTGQVTIEFILESDPDDNIITTVTIDDVVVSTAGDTTPPAVEIGGMTELWPPNHKYHTFNLSDIVLSVGDDIDGQLDIDASCMILSIYSDEPEDVDGKGDGNTLDDIVILGPSSFKVRAERQGTGNGRVYGITFEVFDSSGNSAIATVYLGVPHDKSGKEPIVDDGISAGYIVYY